ncbi:hypothetical protein FC62_GL000344 [Amylolactobacillus amylotrophicus DSM 20534]|uniref:Uncharacterized protein n=3 Tax=Amylolactobacillus TaxID=2767876 RepID=A0A0R1YKE5_9LACO|nr:MULTISPECIES: DUF2785 domain-containing protein [Amylolactobacillus]APT19078.1 hypothetical protein LA20533_07390 [Amylolactobacillus amylophilus DSM 20533 = JCM 1125]KRK38656.1 hypothetical protein FC62_GL000344 [Amylolactobacillus amylotrophicus DSM 20534]KRM42701.1 hypothetical protein FD40_GL000495 [Amylolactobacillus amylophilus DSM 20533 = JCM 1125]GED79561.1 membrane protein [Amylolactobacillus amylophilus]
MEEQIEDLRTQVVHLFEEFNQGNYYNDLLDRFFALQNSVEFAEESSSVRLPRVQGAAKKRFDSLLQSIDEDTTVLTNDDWAFLLRFNGNRDPYIRDQQLFFHFFQAVQRHIITKEQVNFIIQTLLADDKIFWHILEPENDGIYTRSFSWLMLSALVVEDQKYYHALKQTDYYEILTQAVTYLLLERDGRGFVPDFGWAHALLHMANLFEAFNFTDLPRAPKMFFFNAIFFAYFRNNYALSYGEDQRLAGAITVLTGRDQVYVDYVLTVFEYWNENYHRVNIPNDFEFWNAFYNQLRLFNSLLLLDDLPEEIRNFIENDLR